MPNDIKAKFQAISNTVAHYDSVFDAILSPTEEYQEQEAEIHGCIDQFRVDIDSDQIATRWELMDRAIEQGKRLKELEIRYKERASSYETHFNETLEKTFDTFCRQFISIIGLERIVALTRDVTDSKSDPDGALESQVSTPSLESTAAEQSPTAQLRETRLDEDYVADIKPGKRKNNPIVPSTRAKRPRTRETTRHDSEAQPNTFSPFRRERRGRPETRRLRRRLSQSTRHQKFQGITDPSPGTVYFGFWQKSVKWLPVLVLPLQNLQDVGLDGTLDTLGLAKTAPACYKYDKSTGSLAWRQGYNDGEKQVRERKFPVRYFEGQDIPSKRIFGWMAASDLRPFDEGLHSELVGDMSSVRNFLKAYGTKSTKNGARNERDGAADSLPNVGNCPRRACSPIPSGDEEDTECTATAKTSGRRGPSDGLISSPVPQSQPQSDQPKHQPSRKPMQPSISPSSSICHPRRTTVSDAPLRPLEPRPHPHAQPSPSPRVSAQPAQPPSEIADEAKSRQRDIDIISISSSGSGGYFSRLLNTTQPSTLAAPTQSAVECQLNLPITCNDHGMPETQRPIPNAAKIPSEVSMMAQAALDMTRSPTTTQQRDSSRIAYESQACSNLAYQDQTFTSVVPHRASLRQLLNAEESVPAIIRPAGDESSSLDVARRVSSSNCLVPPMGIPSPLSNISHGSFEHNQTLPPLHGSNLPALNSEYSAETRMSTSTAPFMEAPIEPPMGLSSTSQPPTQLIPETAAPRFSQLMNSPVLVPSSIPTGAVVHQSTITSDSYGWGYNLPRDLIQHLESCPCFGDSSLALTRFKNHSGMYVCPLCTGNIPWYWDEGTFAEHLMNQWSIWKGNGMSNGFV